MSRHVGHPSAEDGPPTPTLSHSTHQIYKWNCQIDEDDMSFTQHSRHYYRDLPSNRNVMGTHRAFPIRPKMARRAHSQLIPFTANSFYYFFDFFPRTPLRLGIVYYCLFRCATPIAITQCHQSAFDIFFLWLRRECLYSTLPLHFLILTEYLLGDDVLVAPVVQQGAVTKDIYLPKGEFTLSRKRKKKRNVIYQILFDLLFFF